MTSFVILANPFMTKFQKKAKLGVNPEKLLFKLQAFNFPPIKRLSVNSKRPMFSFLMVLLIIS